MANEDLVNDIEESPEILDQDPDQRWVGEHKKVVFSAIDYNLKDLAEQAESGDLDLQPQYQRRLRWGPERKSRLIESFLMNVPIPPIFLSEESDGTYAVIDGKQRITAITEFLSDSLALTGLNYYADLNGSTFRGLPQSERNFLSRRIPMRAVIILDQSPEEIRLETFQRLNTGGVTLNAQEIRNIAFRGPLNDLVMSLSVEPRFHRMLKIREPERSAIHQQMRDAELVLRFLAFRTTWKSFDGSIKGHMDSYMRDNRAPSSKHLDTLRSRFLHALAVADAGFGEHAFARYVPERGQWRRQVVAAIYDAEMLASQTYDPDVLAERREEILEATRRLFSNARFREATEAATNAKKAFEYRITAVDKLLKRFSR